MTMAGLDPAIYFFEWLRTGVLPCLRFRLLRKPYPSIMLVLAIDTALEACAAAVLDTEAEACRARDLPMKRGHAEALMPMIARVMEAAGTAFTALDRDRGHRRPGQLHRAAGRHFGRPRLGLAAGKPAVGVTTLAAFAAPLIARPTSSPVVAAIDARHDHVYLQVFRARADRSSSRHRAAWRTCSAPRASARRTLSAMPRAMLADRWPRELAALHRSTGSAAPDIAWVAWLGAAADPETAPPAVYLRAPDAKPQGANWRNALPAPDDRLAVRLFVTPRASAVEPATPARCRRFAKLHGARSIADGATASSSSCLPTATCSHIAADGPHDRRLHLLPHGRRRGRDSVGRGRACAARPRPVARPAGPDPSRPPRGTGIARFFSKSRRTIVRRVALRGRVSRPSAGAKILQEASGGTIERARDATRLVVT